MNPTHTINRISTIDLPKVNARLARADAAVRAATHDMTDRHYRRVADGIVTPTDFASLPLPPIPNLPTAIRAVYNYDGLSYWHTDQRATATDLTAIHRGSIFFRDTGSRVLDSATSTQLVAAIHAADEYAAQIAAMARSYAEATRAATEAHIKEQADATRELVALVGA